MTKTQKKSIILCRVYARNTKFKNNYIENSLSFLNRDTVRFTLGAIILSLFCFAMPARADTVYLIDDDGGMSDPFYYNNKGWVLINPINATTTIDTVGIYLKNETGALLDVVIGLAQGFNSETQQLEYLYTCSFDDLAIDFDEWLDCPLDQSYVFSSSDDIVIGAQAVGSGTFKLKYAGSVVYENVYSYFNDIQIGQGGYNFYAYGSIEYPPVIEPPIVETSTSTLAETLDNSFTLTFTAVYVFFAGIFPYVLALGFIFAFAFLLIGYLENG